MEVNYYLFYKNSRDEIKEFQNIPVSAAELLIGLDKGIYARHSQEGIPLISPNVYGEERRLQPKDAVEELKKLNNPFLKTLLETLEKSTDILVIRESRDYTITTSAGLTSREDKKGESYPIH